MDIGKLVPEQQGKKRQGTLSTVVYNELKRMIFANLLHPGAKISFQDVAASMNVSRTPIREALERLSEEGFVERYPNRGYFIAQIKESEVDDLFDLREALEIYALRRTCRTGFSGEQLEQLRAMNERYAELVHDDRTRDRMMADRDFHLTLAAFAGNSALLRALDIGFERLILKLNIHGYSPYYGKSGLDEHRHLMSTLAEQRYEAALTVLGDHIQAARKRVLDQLERVKSTEYYEFDKASAFKNAR